MLKIKLKTSNGNTIRAKTWRTDTVIGHTIKAPGGVEQQQFYFIRVDYDTYRQLSVRDAKAVLQWVDENQIDTDKMTIDQCEEAINARQSDDPTEGENLPSDDEDQTKQDPTVGGSVSGATKS